MKNFILLLAFLTVFTVGAQAATVTRTSYTDSTQSFTPTTGGTVTLVRPSGPALVNITATIAPASSLATVTVDLPSSPKDGDKITLNSTKMITTVTWTGGTVLGFPSSLTPGSSFTIQYSLSDVRWIPVGGMPSQKGIDNLFATAAGTSSPILAKCAGGGDEQALLNAATTASTRRSGILVGHGCQMNNRWQVQNDAFQSLFSWTGANTDGTSIEPNGPRLTVNTDNIFANSPNKTAIDMNGATTLSLNGVNIKGSNQSTYASLIANGTQNGGCCAKNALELNNSSLMSAQALVGPAFNMGTFAPASGTVGNSPNYLPRSLKSQYSNFETAYTGNFSDLMSWNSQYSGGGWAFLQTFGGGGQQIANNRIEFVRGGAWYTGTGDPGGSYFNSNSVAMYDHAAAIIDRANLHVLNDNVATGPTANPVQWNGVFTTDRHWTYNTGWAYGTANAVATNASTSLVQKGAFTAPGYSYTVTFDVVVTSGTVTPIIGGTAGTPVSATGSVSQTIVGGTAQGIEFAGSSFTGSIDNIVVDPSQSSAFFIGGTTANLKNIVIEGNATNGSNQKYGVDILGSGHDYLRVSGLYTGTNLVSAVNYSNMVPTHFVEDTLGAGASGWTGQHSERGRPFCIGRTTGMCNPAFSLDLAGNDNVSKPFGLPSGTTAQRPTCDATTLGGIRYNTTTGSVEGCMGSSPAWAQVSPASTAIYDIGNSSTAFTINLANGTNQHVVLTGNATATMPAVVAGGQFTLEVESGAGGFSLAMTGARWSGGVAPTFSTTASKTDHVGCIANYAATAWDCSAQLGF